MPGLLSTSLYLAHVINIITCLIPKLSTSDVRESRVVQLPVKTTDLKLSLILRKNF